MPLKVNVGLSKKVGQPDYGSLGASCHVEFETDSALLQHDLDGFHRQIKAAFVACRQAVQDELYRESREQILPHQPPNGSNGSIPVGADGPRSGQPIAGGNAQRRTRVRMATASQVRAINSIANRLQLDLAAWLHRKFGLRVPDELSIQDASQTIDELKSLAASNGNGGQH